MTQQRKAETAYELWDFARVMAITAEKSNTVDPPSKHAKPRLRLAPRWLIFWGTFSLLLFAMSFFPSVAVWPQALLVFSRIYSIVVGAVLFIGGVIIALGDPAFHEISRFVRVLSHLAWWGCLLLTFTFGGFALLVMLWLFIYPTFSWEPVTLALAMTLSATCSVLPIMTSTLAPPLMSTMRKPRFYQAIWAIYARTFAIGGLLLSASLYALTFLTKGSQSQDMNFNLIALVITISVGAVGALSSWQRRGLSRLEQDRTAILNALGKVLDALDFGSESSSQSVQAVREIRRLVTPSPFETHSARLSPSYASYEIVEMIKLIEWAIDPTESASFPISLSHRSEPGRQHADLFSQIAAMGKTGVRERARAFVSRCYFRLLENAKDDSDVETVS